MQPSDVGWPALRLPSPFAAVMDFPFLQIRGDPFLIALHFPLLLSPPFVQDFSGTKRCLDHWGLSERSYSEGSVDSIFRSPKTLPKSLSGKSFTLPSLSRSKVNTAPPPPPSARPQTQHKKKPNSPHRSGSWGVPRKAGPARALLMSQKHVSGEHLHGQHLLRERTLSAWGRVEESLISAYGRS